MYKKVGKMKRFLWVLVTHLAAFVHVSDGLNNQVAVLSKALRMLYVQGGILGVLRRGDGVEDMKPSVLVQSALAAAKGDRGMASGILNACLGRFYQDADSGAPKAVALMKEYDSSETIEPDLVSLCLAFGATCGHPATDQESQIFLERAEAFYHQEDSVIRQHTRDEPVNWTKITKEFGVKILHDSEDVLVVSKPSGMVCYHGSRSKPKSSDVSLEQCLLRNGVNLSTLNAEGRGFVHRIDRGTSGCLVLSKTNRAHAQLIAEFFVRSIEKSYQALLYSPTTRLPPTKKIDLDIDGRPATSTCIVEREIGKGVTLVQIRTEQGRRHQVRRHCAQGLKAPIVLDPLYGGESIMFDLKLPSLRRARAAKRFCLHANRLEIPKFDIHVDDPIPDWWEHLEMELSKT